jgi:hypothetical protein
MANPTADAPVRATRAKSAPPAQAVEVKSLPAPLEPKTIWSEQARPLLRRFAQDLHDLNYTVVSDDAPGPAKKLAELADGIIDDLRKGEDESDAWAAPHGMHYELSYRVGVLLDAAYRAVDQTEGDAADRTRQAAILAQAASWTQLVSELVDKLPESIEALREVCKGCSVAMAPPRPPKPRRPTEQPAGAFNGHTPKQVELAFQNIASMAGTLRDHLMEVAADERDVNPWMTSMMVSQIGSVADIMSGVRVMGNAADWSIGVSFRQAGAA